MSSKQTKVVKATKQETNSESKAPRKNAKTESKSDSRADDYKEMPEREHILTRPDILVGSVEVVPKMMPILLANPENESDKPIGKICEVNISDALLKCFDEVLTNATDQFISKSDTKSEHKITISTAFDYATGECMVTNTGSCIPVTQKEGIDGNMIYVPEMVFSHFRAGSNFNDQKRKEGRSRCVGGRFGYGVKVAAVFSNSFTIDIVDDVTRQHYVQTFNDNLAVVNPPTIKEIKAKTVKPHVCVKWLPDYKKLGFKTVDKDVLATIGASFKTRVYQLAGSTGAPIDFNDNKVLVKNIFDYATLFSDGGNLIVGNVNPGDSAESKIEGEWRFAIDVNPQNPNVTNHQIFANGVYTPNGGTHLDSITTAIVNAIKSKVKKMLGETHAYRDVMITNNLYIYAACIIVDAKFDGARKNKLDNKSEQFAGRNISKDVAGKIFTNLEPLIASQILNKEIKDSKSRKIIKNIDKYLKCSNLGKDATLIIVEGDSAFGQIQNALSKLKLFNKFGLFALQGKPINARKHVKNYKDKEGNDQFLRDKTYQEHKRINAFLSAMNLDFRKRYKTASDCKSLNYGRIAFCVDADKDGTHIFSLCLGLIELHWSELIEQKKVITIATPVLRAVNIKQKKAIEFTSEKVFREWYEKQLEQLNNVAVDDEEDDNGVVVEKLPNWKIKYYKGLASHSNESMVGIFEDLDAYIVNVNYDKTAREVFDIYLNEDADPRKIELSTPVVESEIKDKANRDCTIILREGLKDYYLADLSRHLLGIDGFNNSSRKVASAIGEIFATRNDEWKIDDLISEVGKMKKYHHGPASLGCVITHQAQSFRGAKILPLLLDQGNVGNPMIGLNKFGSSRYVFANLNKELYNVLYPSTDVYQLQYNFDDGIRVEPKYFLPIICMAIAETYQSVCAGYTCEIWSRDTLSIIENHRRLVNDESAKLVPMKASTWKFNPKCLIQQDGVEYSVGSYTYDAKKNMLYIKDLPMRRWNSSYHKLFDADPLVLDWSDFSSEDGVDIQLKLDTGAIEKIKAEYEADDKIDAIMRHFKLVRKLRCALNFIDIDGKLQTFDSYEAALRYYHPIRKAAYIERVKRIIKMLEIKINYLEQIQRFTKEASTLGLNKLKSPTEQSDVLEKNKYVKINAGNISTPKFVAIDKIEDTIYKQGASYKYLLGLTWYSLNEEAYKKRQKEIEDYKAELELYREKDDKFPGAKIWLKELDNLESLIKKVAVSGTWKPPTPKLKLTKA